MTGQKGTLLRLLRQGRTISNLEALHYGIASVSSRISELKKRGYNIQANRKLDALGRPYASYKLIQESQVDAR